MECIFCKIVNKELPAQIALENERLIAIKDIKPAAPVHYLVIPKLHIASIAHLKGDHRDMLADLVYAAKDLAKQLTLNSYKLNFNVGRGAGQEIDHLHLHLMGGWKDVVNEVKQ